MAPSIDKLQQGDHDLLIRVETKMDSLTDEVRQNNTSTTKVAADHETRIRNLENIVEINRGAANGVKANWRTILEITGIIAALITAYATYLLGHH